MRKFQSSIISCLPYNKPANQFHYSEVLNRSFPQCHRSASVPIEFFSLCRIRGSDARYFEMSGTKREIRSMTAAIENAQLKFEEINHVYVGMLLM